MTALSNEDWPLQSLRLAQDTCLKPTDEAACARLNHATETDFTLEVWIQRRVARHLSKKAGRWFFQSAAFGFGVDEDAKVIVFFHRKWLTSTHEADFIERKWLHWSGIR